MNIHSANVHEAQLLSVSTESLVDAARARTCQELLAAFSPSTAGQARLLEFTGVGNRDVYNVTAPFEFDGVRLIAGRVEARDSEHSELMLFREVEGRWTPYFTSPMFRSLQDPCVSFVGDELIIGGVRYPIEVPGDQPTWRMEFFHGRSLATLRHMLTGPMRMKDIRFCELADGRVAVLTRPQGAKGGRGKIGFCIADSLEDITAEMIDAAPILNGQFVAEEWGGANEAQLLPDGSIGVLGHIARRDTCGNRHYYPMAFSIDPETAYTTPIRIIARRDMFPFSASKRADLVDVVFSGGLERHADGYATLWVGLSDAAAGTIRIEDPFAVTIAQRLEASL